MPMTFAPEILDGVLSRLRAANLSFAAQFPGDPGTRQAVHTVYGGAQIFKSDTAQKLGGIALNLLLEYASNFVTFAKAVGLRGSAGGAQAPDARAVHERRPLESSRSRGSHRSVALFSPGRQRETGGSHGGN